MPRFLLGLFSAFRAPGDRVYTFCDWTGGSGKMNAPIHVLLPLAPASSRNPSKSLPVFFIYASGPGVGLDHTLLVDPPLVHKADLFLPT